MGNDLIAIIARLVAGALLGAIALVLLLVWWHSARAAAPTTECGLPVPALLVVLPDGTEVPARELRYQLDARRIDVIADHRLLCSGFEGG